MFPLQKTHGSQRAGIRKKPRLARTPNAWTGKEKAGRAAAFLTLRRHTWISQD